MVRRFPVSLILISSIYYLVSNSPALAQTPDAGSWTTAGANPQRTSWSSTEVSGKLTPDWYKIFKNTYILQRSQIVAVNDTLYVSTSRGLYALDAATGSQKWVYPTELPLGDTPTYDNGTIYIGGFDRKMHAVNASTGTRKWTYTAESGFQNSPLVVSGTVYAGNRDGYFYALDAATGGLKWKYQTGGPIAQSAAADSAGTIYFASNDSYAYALNSTGTLKWKSAKLPGDGFYSWWPVVAGNYVIFTGGENYRKVGPGTFGSMSNDIEKTEIWPSGGTDNQTLVGPTVSGQTWAHGATVVDYTKVVQYYNSKSYRRTYFVLDKNTGAQAITAPVLWLGSYGGSRHPPVYDAREDVLYQSNVVWYHSFSPRGQVTGWKPGTSYVSLPTSSSKNASDEPMGYTMGGNHIYWVRCCDRAFETFSISSPGTGWSHFGTLTSIISGYNSEYWNPESDYTAPHATFGKNGVYGFHGDTTGPTPYKGRLYMFRSNALIAFGAAGSKTGTSVTASLVSNADAIPARETLQTRLAAYVQKTISAGHLRPGYLTSGIFDQNQSLCGFPNAIDYFSRPWETIYALTLALPHLSGTLKDQTKSYLQNEYNSYLPYNVTHIGWSGSAREVLDPPSDVSSSLTGGQTSGTPHPFAFYALWKYAQEFGNAKAIFDAASPKFPSPESDSELQETAWKHNAYIAGLVGYLNLRQLAGYADDSAKRTQLNNMMASRASAFSKDSPWVNDSFFSGRGHGYCRDFNTMRNFLYMTPELGDYLNANVRAKVDAAVAEYSTLTPFWFVSKFENSVAESVLHPLYDIPAMFAAKAYIQGATYSELAKYIDVPAFDKGDMFYIQNVAIALSAGGTGPTAPPVSPTLTQPPVSPTIIPSVPGDANGDGHVNGVDYVVWFNHYKQTGSGGPAIGDFNNSGTVDGVDYVVWLNHYGL